MVLTLVENLISKFQCITEIIQFNYFVVFQLQCYMSPKRAYLDVYKVLWAVLFNFCFKEGKGIAALPKKRNENKKIPPQPMMASPPLLMRKIHS